MKKSGCLRSLLVNNTVSPRIKMKRSKILAITGVTLSSVFSWKTLATKLIVIKKRLYNSRTCNPQTVADVK